MSELIRAYHGVHSDFGKDKLVRKNSVIQRHSLPGYLFTKPVIVIRDPRDMLVSFYFFELHRNRENNMELVKAINFDPDGHDKDNFRRYCSFKLEHPEKSFPGFSYTTFVAQWLKEKHLLTSYEDLHQDTGSVLSKVIDYLGHPVEPQRIDQAVKMCAFEKHSGGRKLGEEDPSAFRRKGIVGDWKNYFDPESLEVVNRLIFEPLKGMNSVIDNYQRDY